MLRVGIGATPYATMDSMGRPMGFNDPLSLEHYFIMLRNFRVSDLLTVSHIYEWVLVVAHLAGFALLWMSSKVSSRLVRWYFAAQSLAFPIGVPAMALLPMFCLGSLFSSSDREGFVDVPFIMMIAHPAWVMTSLYIVFAMRGEGLGLRIVWQRFRQWVRAGTRIVSKAIG